jgi:hypothetical protein
MQIDILINIQNKEPKNNTIFIFNKYFKMIALQQN